MKPIHPNGSRSKKTPVRCEAKPSAYARRPCLGLAGLALGDAEVPSIRAVLGLQKGPE